MSEYGAHDDSKPEDKSLECEIARAFVRTAVEMGLGGFLVSYRTEALRRRFIRGFVSVELLAPVMAKWFLEGGDCNIEHPMRTATDRCRVAAAMLVLEPFRERFAERVLAGGEM